MAYLHIGKENSASVELHFHDHGRGQPVILIHGWPLSERSWENQEPALLSAGYRVITYDRRGFGESSKPANGYDYDSLADDLNALITHLDLREAVLVGFSMGAGEVARYLRVYGAERVDKAVYISGITPALLKAEDNPEGIEHQVFEDMMQKVMEDRPAFLSKFLKDFYNAGLLHLKAVSDEAVHLDWITAAMASPHATLKCIGAWLEDFRQDLKSIEIPTLVIHGDSDKIVPIDASGRRMTQFLANCRFEEVKGGPHGILRTHAKQVSDLLLSFLDEISVNRNLGRDTASARAPGSSRDTVREMNRDMARELEEMRH